MYSKLIWHEHCEKCQAFLALRTKAQGQMSLFHIRHYLKNINMFLWHGAVSNIFTKDNHEVTSENNENSNYIVSWRFILEVNKYPTKKKHQVPLKYAGGVQIIFLFEISYNKWVKDISPLQSCWGKKTKRPTFSKKSKSTFFFKIMLM